MTAYKRGEIILVPFPFSNQSAIKKRPAVIISSDNYINTSSDVIIMAITSQIQHISDIGERRLKDWKAEGLLKPSAIKSAVSTLEQKLIVKKLGVLSTDDNDALNSALKELLSL